MGREMPTACDNSESIDELVSTDAQPARSGELVSTDPAWSQNGPRMRLTRKSRQVIGHESALGPEPTLIDSKNISNFQNLVHHSFNSSIKNAIVFKNKEDLLSHLIYIWKTRCN